VSLVFFLAVGTSVSFFYQLNQIKLSVNRELKSGEPENLLSFRFTQAEYDGLNWLEKGKEFRLNGKMYDIASIQKTKNSVTVFCSYDTKETRVRQVFANLLSGSSTKGLPLRQLVKIIGQKYLQKNFNLEFFRSPQLWVFKPYTFSVITFSPDLPKPPPDFF